MLEITERTLVKESEIDNDVLAELAALGVGLVLDDFGTGYSMMGYLKRMPITALKIDQSFIEGIPGDADSRAIVHAMIAVAKHFKLKVVAEGIESLEQVQYMRGHRLRLRAGLLLFAVADRRQHPRIPRALRYCLSPRRPRLPSLRSRELNEPREEAAMSYENILVEIRERVGLDHPEPSQGAQRAE